MAKSPLRWAGGKGKLLKDLTSYMPTAYNRYIENFAGGASLFFHLRPKNAILIDCNEELINFYTVLRDHTDELLDSLEQHINHEEYFYYIREQDQCKEYKDTSDVERASRFLFLNKTCFNGLHRVNSKGYFNVPFGFRNGPTINDKFLLMECAESLKDTHIERAHFSKILDYVKSGDFVYMDPPYDILDSNSFTGYNKDDFNQKDQQFVKNLCDELNRREIKWLLSNASTSFIQDLYKEYTVNTIDVSRCINSDAAKRGKVEEVLITNYPIKKLTVDLFGG
jgi:DNA adenine methylase